MASNGAAAQAGLNATQVCELFVQLAGQLFHPAQVLQAMRPVAELHGEFQVVVDPTQQT